jgi:4-hydroxy-3-polyprenylbenzoate decarboxylase
MLKLARVASVSSRRMPAFYNQPKTLDDMVDHGVIRTLDLIGPVSEATPRWEGLMQSHARQRRGRATARSSPRRRTTSARGST